MLLRIIFFLLFLLVAPHLFLLWRFRTSLTRGQRLLLSLPNALLIAGSLLLSFFQTYSPANAQLTGLFLVLFIGWTGAELFLSLFCLLSLAFKKIPIIEKMILRLGFAVFVAVILIATYGHFRGMSRLQVVHEDLYFQDLPAGFDGYRMAVFSDFHLGTYGTSNAMPRKVVETILAQKPQVILFLGDLVNYRTQETEPAFAELQRLKAPDGVFSVMGNHDYQMHVRWDSPRRQYASIEQLKETERRAGWTLLCNENRIITHGGDSMAILGVENDGKPPFPELGDLSAAQSGLSDTLANGQPLFKVLLSHDPSHWRRKVLPQTDIQLTLSGHTHATQFQIGRFSPARWVYPEWGGLYREGSRQLYVSKGIGGALLPFRFGAWPDINILTLHKTQE